ncbi:uncharacterized protein BXZ73DRAFT_82643, partial [Epithele typhae]|uniref:uncharacterized protein n=1 Tax=Epithele typhae TaxID=378194 RepID=UPI0020084DD0
MAARGSSCDLSATSQLWLCQARKMAVGEDTEKGRRVRTSEGQTTNSLGPETPTDWTSGEDEISAASKHRRAACSPYINFVSAALADSCGLCMPIAARAPPSPAALQTPVVALVHAASEPVEAESAAQARVHDAETNTRNAPAYDHSLMRTPEDLNSKHQQLVIEHQRVAAPLQMRSDEERYNKAAGGLAVYSKADVVLLGDVLVALDAHTARWIVDNWPKSDQGRTVLLVTHNMAMASPIADFIVSFGNDGRVFNQGSFSKMIAKDDTPHRRAARRKTIALIMRAPHILPDSPTPFVHLENTSEPTRTSPC